MEWVLGVLTAVVVAYFTALFAAKNEKQRIREELKLEHAVETAITQLLDKQGWELRSFDTIKRHVRGFDDDTLRQYLVRAGAIAFDDQTRRSEGPGKVERWGLLKNNIERLHRADDPD
ncbi:hypothetical protein [Roseobacter sinensis]|uniref:Uncharacterized protein n=1 Tax=Roseobacter sinensis TaxID=2931391 RepID=A0ABT3BI50_9RHOB|nr:hypothetical protein [Roseobacter sp. WL0113]MCV3273054.1 hypothetical protein [Roseobacter sp. WL0113]